MDFKILMPKHAIACLPDKENIKLNYFFVIVEACVVCTCIFERMEPQFLAGHIRKLCEMMGYIFKMIHTQIFLRARQRGAKNRNTPQSITLQKRKNPLPEWGESLFFAVRRNTYNIMCRVIPTSTLNTKKIHHE